MRARVATAKENLVHMSVHNFPCQPPSPFIRTFIVSAKTGARRFITSTALVAKQKRGGPVQHRLEEAMEEWAAARGVSMKAVSLVLLVVQTTTLVLSIKVASALLWSPLSLPLTGESACLA